MIKKLLFLIFTFQTAYSLQTHLLSTSKTIAKTQTAVIHAIPEDNEFIHAEKILLSFSHPSVRIKNWEILEEPITKHVSTLKKSQKGFGDSFTIDITFEEPVQKLNINTFFTISYFSTNANDQTVVKQKNIELLSEKLHAKPKTESLTKEQIIKTDKSKFMQNFSSLSLLIAKKRTLAFLETKVLFVILFAILFFLILFFLTKALTLIDIFAAFAPITYSYIAHAYFSLATAHVTTACFFLFSSIWFLFQPRSSVLKQLIGILFAAIVLPLIVQTYVVVKFY